MKRFEVENHEPSFLPDGEWELVWADEFDGTELDRTKWDYRLSMMGRRWEAWTNKGVALDGNSNLVFTLIEEDGKPVSSQLQTGYNFMDEPVSDNLVYGEGGLYWRIGKLRENMFTHSYGYYECRCRLQQKEGWWSAFWIQSPTIGASIDSKRTGTEIDILESFKPGEVAPHWVHTGGYGSNMQSFCAGEKVSVDKEVFHRFGVLWDETGYTFYIDGENVGKTDKNLSTCPEFILIGTEVHGYRQKGNQAVKEAFDAIGDTFVVDHIRVFDRKKEDE